jgi:hypothetical protein
VFKNKKQISRVHGKLANRRMRLVDYR